MERISGLKRQPSLGRVLTLPFLLAAVCVALTALAACTVGPDYRRPEAPKTDMYTPSPLPGMTASAPVAGGETQRFVLGQEIAAEWWTLFHSEPLDRMIRGALAESPTIAAAEAALRQAQENVRAQAGALYPQVDANFTASRQKYSAAAFGQPGAPAVFLTLYNASVDVSYSVDLFGGVRRGLEALRSQVDYQRYQIEATYLALTANIVTSAVKEASLRGQIGATREMVAVQERLLGVVEQQLELGGASLADVLAQRAQLAQTRATLPPLEKDLGQNRHLLAVLSGKLPHEAAGIAEFSLEGLRLPQELPVSLPSSLVSQRPDIAASEALLHVASAEIGVATANLYPQITLTGSLGSEATRLADLFDYSSTIWSLGAGLLQPLFHGGTLSAKRRAAVAAYDQAMAQYRETVLLAFQNVADVLRALDDDARTLAAQAQAEAAARDTFELTGKQFEVGAVSYLSLLNAERQYQQARIGVIQAQAARLADTAALFQALGGGWWNRNAKNGPDMLKE